MDTRALHRCIVAAAAGLLVLIAFYYITQSIYFGFSLIRPLPWFDQWSFVKAYFRYLDGSETLFHLLFAQHNQHRIVTTNIFLLLDAQLFDMRGIFPIIIMYMAAALIAFLIAKSTVKSTIDIFIGFPIALAAMWSISQYRVLFWPFALQLIFIHLFALACYQTLATALLTAGPRRYVCLSLACAADAVGVFSLGSGPFIVLPTIAMAMWLQKLDRVLLCFVAVHSVLVACFFYGYDWKNALYGGVFPWTAYLDFVVGFLGVSAGGRYTGAIALAAYIVAIVLVSWTTIVKGKKLDAAACVFLTLATFVVVEAVVASFNRVFFGIGPRYASASIMFLVALFAFLWRMTNVLEKRKTAFQVSILSLAAMLLVAANLAYYETFWRAQVALLDRATTAFKRDEYPEDIVRIWVLSPYPGLIEDVKRLAKLRLGPFAP